MQSYTDYVKYKMNQWLDCRWCSHIQYAADDCALSDALAALLLCDDCGELYFCLTRLSICDNCLFANDAGAVAAGGA
jgi:hypothetical protein